jgi:hypothetical protein
MRNVTAKKRRTKTGRRRPQSAPRARKPAPQNEELSVLGVGCLIHQEAIETTQFRSDATFLDYDVVVWDPETTINEYRHREYGEVYMGLPSLGDDQSAHLLSDIARRRSEMRQLLELGRTIVIFAPTPQVFYVGTGDKTTSGTGRNAKVTRLVRRQNFFEVFPFEMTAVAAKGTKAEVRSGEPFAKFWRSMHDLLSYRAYFEVVDAVPLLAIRGTDKIVGAQLRIARGFVLIIPAPFWRTDEVLEEKAAPEALKLEEKVVATLTELVSALRQETGDFKLPAWSETYELAGEARQRQSLAGKERQRDALLLAINDAKDALATLEQRKILFTGSGVALETQVKNAFRALGFDVREGAPGRDDFIAIRGSRVAVVEVKGVTKTAAEKHSAQLEKWVAGYYEANGQHPKAILVVNTYSETPLEDRPAANFPDQMLPYATGRGHALVTGVQLLGAWLDVEEHPERQDEVATSLLDATGPWERFTDWRTVLGIAPTTTPRAATTDA